MALRAKVEYQVPWTRKVSYSSEGAFMTIKNTHDILTMMTNSIKRQRLPCVLIDKENGAFGI